MGDWAGALVDNDEPVLAVVHAVEVEDVVVVVAAELVKFTLILTGLQEIAQVLATVTLVLLTVVEILEFVNKELEALEDEIEMAG